MATEMKTELEYETPFVHAELKENGITYTKIKPVEMTDQIWKEHLQITLSKLDDRKIKILVDATNTLPFDRKFRKEFNELSEQISKAVAVVSDSPLGNTLANLYLVFVRSKVPIKMFKDFDTAEEWLLDID